MPSTQKQNQRQSKELQIQRIWSIWWLEQIKKYCRHSVEARSGAVLLSFGFVSAPTQVFLDMLRRASLAKTS